MKGLFIRKENAKRRAAPPPGARFFFRPPPLFSSSFAPLSDPSSFPPPAQGAPPPCPYGLPPGAQCLEVEMPTGGPAVMAKEKPASANAGTAYEVQAGSVDQASLYIYRDLSRN